AADALTAKQLRSYAWLERQRGERELARGDLDEAERRFARGGVAYSGDWALDRDVAKLRAAQGRFEDAVALYADVVARVPLPALQHALGARRARAGRPAEARRWHERALAGYRASVDRGEVLYWHHLVDYHLDVAGDPQEALRWAQRDHQLRPHAATAAA